MDRVQLIPVQELAPGAVGAIRNQVVKGLVAKAATELKMSPDLLVVRDIRPQSDLDWASDNATFAGTAITDDIWVCATHGSNTGYQTLITSASTTMADQRYVAIWGLKDWRYEAETIVAQSTTLWKFVVGNSTKAIWDISRLYGYKTQACGVCNSAVIIPQNAYFQIYGYIIATTTASYVGLEGCVVEPRGKVLSP